MCVSKWVRERERELRAAVRRFVFATHVRNVLRSLLVCIDIQISVTVVLHCVHAKINGCMRISLEISRMCC